MHYCNWLLSGWYANLLIGVIIFNFAQKLYRVCCQVVQRKWFKLHISLALSREVCCVWAAFWLCRLLNREVTVVTGAKTQSGPLSLLSALQIHEHGRVLLRNRFPLKQSRILLKSKHHASSLLPILFIYGLLNPTDEHITRKINYGPSLWLNYENSFNTLFINMSGQSMVALEFKTYHI